MHYWYQGHILSNRIKRGTIYYVNTPNNGAVCVCIAPIPIRHFLHGVGLISVRRRRMPWYLCSTPHIFSTYSIWSLRQSTQGPILCPCLTWESNMIQLPNVYNSQCTGQQEIWWGPVIVDAKPSPDPMLTHYANTQIKSIIRLMQFSNYGV